MIVIDIETTGLDVLQHSILEIGALDFNNPYNKFFQRCRISSEEKVDINALDVNGYYKTKLCDSGEQSLYDLLQNFVKWVDPIKDKTLAGQNVDFDISFLKRSLTQTGLNWSLGWRKVDLHTLAYCDLLKKGHDAPLKNDLSDLNGDYIMQYVGLPSEPRPHLGINGAMYAAEAISRLIYGKSLINQFERYIIPSHFNR